MNSEPTKTVEPGIALGKIAREFLRLGFIAFGGPAAHIALMEEQFVRRRAWVTRERFLDLVGAVSLLPGPSSTELAIYLGQIRGGMPGLIVAGAAFIIPAAILVVGLAWAYVRFGEAPQLAGLLFGVKPVVVALIAQAIWTLGKTALKSWELTALAVVALALAIMNAPALAVLIGTGMAWMVANRAVSARTTDSTTLAAFLPATSLNLNCRLRGHRAGVFLFSESRSRALRKRICATGVVARGFSCAAALVDGSAVARCHCNQPSHARPFFHGRDFHRVRASRLERCAARNGRNVLAGTSLCCCHSQFSPAFAPVESCQRVSRWSECRSRGADGAGGLAIRSCNARERACGRAGSREPGAYSLVPRQFNVGDRRRRGRRRSLPSCALELILGSMCVPQMGKQTIICDYHWSCGKSFMERARFFPRRPVREFLCARARLRPAAALCQRPGGACRFQARR
jgi:chromate transport protein ChrA